MTAHETTVCVVGAGPVGLVAAIALARARVPFVLVDADEGPVVESRAIIVHAGMLEVLDDLGVAGDLVARGWRVPSVHVALGDRVLASVSLAHVSGRFPFILTVPQSTTETVLRRRLADLGQEPLAGHTVTGLTRHGDVHEVTGTARDGGPFTVRCRHVIGADGRSSAIRAALGVRLPRNPYPQLIHLADVTLSAPPEASGLYTHLSAQGSCCSAHCPATGGGSSPPRTPPPARPRPLPRHLIGRTSCPSSRVARPAPVWSRSSGRRPSGSSTASSTGSTTAGSCWPGMPPTCTARPAGWG